MNTKEKTILEAYEKTQNIPEIVKLLKGKKFKLHEDKLNSTRHSYSWSVVNYVLKKYKKVTVSKKRNKPDGLDIKQYDYCYRWAQILWAFKQGGSKCKECGHSDPRHLVYHHRDPSTKVSGIARMFKNGYDKQTILEEINKCDLLCKHCHTNKHVDGQRLADNSRFIKELVSTI